MIASDRSQNIIIVATILTAIISSGFIIGNAQYYGGSYILAESLQVSLTEIRLSNADPNSTSDPTIALTFDMEDPVVAEGNVRITFLGATLYLNNDILSLTSFSYTPTLANQYLYSNLNRSISMTQTASSVGDKETIFNAYLSSTWAWNVTLRYSLIVFDEDISIMWKWLYFYTTDFVMT